MPPENRIRSRDAGQLLEHLPPEDLAFDSQAPPLVVAEQNSVLPELLSEDPILRQEVLDGVLLSAIDPSRRGSGARTAMAAIVPSFSSGCAVRIRSIRDRRVPVKRPKHGSRGAWQESLFQPHAVRLTFLTLRPYRATSDWCKMLFDDSKL